MQVGKRSSSAKQLVFCISTGTAADTTVVYVVRGLSAVGEAVKAKAPRAAQLSTQPPRSWIEQRLQRSLATFGRRLMWGKGHSGVEVNEEANRKANIAAYGGRVGALWDQVTPAGIRQEYTMHSKQRHFSWDRKSIKGLVYIVTDRGPLRW